MMKTQEPLGARVSKKRVAVIGGGVSGLAACKAFRERGHDVLAFERGSDLGGVWELSRAYPGVQTQSPKALYCYSDFPMPTSYPEWPNGEQVHAYLHRYAHKHQLATLYQLDTCVLSMRRCTNRPTGWVLTLQNASHQREESFDFVVVATGQFSDKKMVRHPGQGDFEAAGGEVLHSSECTDVSLFKDKKVLIIGGSKSATDLTVSAAVHGAKSSTMVYRTNLWRSPYYILGINFKHLLYMRAQEAQFNGWNPKPLSKLIKMLVSPLVWANFRALEYVLKTQLQLEKHDMVPDGKIEHDVNCALPIVTPGFFEGLNDCSIKAIKNSISHYEGGTTVCLLNGDKIAVDLVVQAIGWKMGQPFLSESDKQTLIDADGQYHLHRFSVNPDIEGLGFVGFNSSFCSVLSAELIANWLVRFMDGQLRLQPDRNTMRNDIDKILHWRRTERPAAQVNGGLCSAPFHFRHFDELLTDIGCSKKRKLNPLSEYFRHPDAKAFSEYLASAPQYWVS